ncbi:hypothetical protein JCM39194_17740 [Desulfotomaculum varum]
MIDVYGLFKHSLELELGLRMLHANGFAGAKLTVVVLQPVAGGQPTILDTMYNYDRRSLLDGMAIFATVGMLLGTIYGSLVYIGPIALGLFGLLAGAGAGYLVDKAVNKDKTQRCQEQAGEVIVTVHCQDDKEARTAETIMRHYLATAMGRRYVKSCPPL